MDNLDISNSFPFFPAPFNSNSNPNIFNSNPNIFNPNPNSINPNPAPVLVAVDTPRAKRSKPRASEASESETSKAMFEGNPLILLV